MLGVRRNRESAEYSCSTLRFKTHVNSLVSATLDNRGVETEELCPAPSLVKRTTVIEAAISQEP